jgi:hypothetical protein
VLVLAQTPCYLLSSDLDPEIHVFFTTYDCCGKGDIQDVVTHDLAASLLVRGPPQSNYRILIMFKDVFPSVCYFIVTFDRTVSP